MHKKVQESSKKDAKEQARKNLMDVGIIDELENLIGFYKIDTRVVALCEFK